MWQNLLDPQQDENLARQTKMAKATYVLAFLLGVLVIYAWHRHAAALEAAKPSYLFLLNGTVTDVQKQVAPTPREDIEVVALSLQPEQVMQFTDRPYHLAKTIGWKDLESYLTDMIYEQKNPPNASLVVFQEKDHVVDSAIVEIVEVELQGKSVFTMKVTRVDDGAAATQAALPDIPKGMRVSLTINNSFCFQEGGQTICSEE